MSERNMVTIEGNQAAAYIAHLTNEVIAIYPITPSSDMGEFSDEWSAKGVKNLWGSVPDVIEMQSEGGAVAAVHGALQGGSLSTTFTASQGLLLMIPTMYKVAGELTPTVFHVSARALACQGLSIFGDHSDVMSVRQTGFAMLSSNSVQEVMDFALIAQAATLESRIPFVHFFDGFRVSHEVNKVDQLSREVVRAMIDEELVSAHRARALNPDKPVLRGTSQNPDVYFQGRETVNPYYNAVPGIVQNCMDRLAKHTGRHYKLFEYVGAEDADRVLICMGSGNEAIEETVETLTRRGEKVGLVKVRLFRPFAPEFLLQAIPATARKIAVLDRTKEPGSDGEPLYKDVLGAIAQAFGRGELAEMPKVVGGRYGLASKEFTPGMIKGVYDELKKDSPKNNFTVGIIDDVTHTSLEWDPGFLPDSAEGVTSAVFYGLGADGTVGANKNSIKIIGEETDNYGQGYFQYDSKKAGAVTVSHLRFGPKPIRSPYLVGDNQATFIGCHQPIFVERFDMLRKAAPGATFLLNSHCGPDEVWDSLPRKMQQQMIEKQLKFYVVDAYAIAKKTGMGRRINTIMQTCFFAISGILPRDEAIAKIKEAAEKTYGKKGRKVLETNFAAIDQTLANLHQVEVPSEATSTFEMRPPVVGNAPDFVKEVTAEIIAGRGDLLPVSKIPADGTWPLGTAAFEKRELALELPKWEEDLCTQCGKCPMVCPHAAIRSKVFPGELAKDAPAAFKHVPVKGKDFEPGTHISYQVSPDDCTGCTLCVDICPVTDKKDPNRKALNMVADRAYHLQERPNWDFFLTLPDHDTTEINTKTIKGAQIMQPLFEFSGACVGCGETPYVKLASQLFGDRMVIANATGCSSIYGGNLPTTPWTTNKEGRGPAWCNSLFEDNAEFGLGYRLSYDMQTRQALELLDKLRDKIGGELVDALYNADQTTDKGIKEQRERVEELRKRLAAIPDTEARSLEAVSSHLTKKSVWIMGGDGWAYDIGYGGLDHVLASGRNVNILVLDTETYSNTGGQKSKASPKGAVAKFAAGGKPDKKKDLALMAMSYGNVYVAQVSYGAKGKDIQTLRAFQEAESYDGVSLIIAYAPCIAQGINLLTSNHKSQTLAMETGHTQLFRYDPRRADSGESPLKLDSKPPSRPLHEFTETEGRFAMLERIDPEAAARYEKEAQQEIRKRFQLYTHLAEIAAEDIAEK
ncbi:MAG TPA: pyruvate:ferredoxin (flavodoxin) oxidoreductase [Sedimenticola sp.]|nr:pyruvate:ferredoxin (flavodoxin) oxidoreductase [Sedimenticola sp.]